MKIAVYAGTFDPITKGHLSVLSRAATLFDQVIVAVAADNNKHTLFTLEERKVLAEASVQHLPNVKVEAFTGLLVEFAKSKGASALIRGLRMVSDFEYEILSLGGYEGPKKKVDCNQIIRRDFSKALKGELDV